MSTAAGSKCSSSQNADRSRVAGPVHGGEKTELEVLFGGVDAGPEGGSPFATPGRDHLLCTRVAGATAHAVADPGADLDGFVEQGERAFGLLDREHDREDREAERERGVDAGGAGDAHRFVDGRDRGVERRSVAWSAAPSMTSACASS